ncbi:hypothetical protein A9Q84_03800 [Halobacteriovorax marinus]|uniref:Transmembrane protein n=1 Tax=Halobacteriovorax marinus TaxID=97084 RepID=A0A1Y5FAB2_9BACT|nr:hypothetical protein A9Q84_03800 [Halobacteriovorax marinus]
MKTIFSYLRKCLLTYTIAFALVQVQVLLPIQNLKYSAGYVMAEEGEGSGDQEEQAAQTSELTGSITKGADGVAQKSGQVKTDGARPNAFMDMLIMLIYGYATSRAVMMQTPVPMDTMIAAGGGIIYVVGELYAFNAFKDHKGETIDYVMREDGTDPEKQIDMLKEHKKNYDEIAKTAKTKGMIQKAAAAAFGIAAIKGFWTAATMDTVDAGCALCVGPATAIIASKQALEKTPMMSEAKYGPIQIKCGAIGAANAASVITWTTAVTAAVAAAAIPGAGVAAAALVVSTKAGLATCVAATSSCAVSVALCRSDNIHNNYLTFANMANDESQEKLVPSPDNSFEKFAREGIKIPGFEDGINPKMINESIVEIEAEELTDKFQVASFIDRENPFYNLNSGVSFNGLNFQEKVKSYVRNRDLTRFYQGEIVSSSTEQYSSFKNTMLNINNNSTSEDYGNSLEMALHYGIDLLVPSVNANSFMGMFAAIIGIVVALKMSTATAMDFWMTTPLHRGIAWTVGAGLAMVSAGQTAKIQETAESNAEKIQTIIDRYGQMKNASKQNLSGYNVSIPSRIPFPISGNEPINLGPGKAPCVNSNKTSGCKSLKSGIEKNQGFSSLGGNFGALAGSVGGAADAISGSGSIPGSGVDGIVNLSKKNEAIQKKLRQMQRKVNSGLKKTGRRPLDFDKLNKKLLARLRKSTANQLRKSGKSAGSLLASLGPVSNKGDSKEEKKVAAANNTKPTIGGAGRKAKRAPVFSLDLENEGGNEGLSAEDVLANQEAVNAMNEESQDDIVFNKEVSIFKVISVRYLKSGFNKLLEEEK